MKSKTTDISQCIHCGKCREHCLFLDKYKMDLSEGEKLRELAYHCFLCGRCGQVCPKGIDGREVILQYRRERVEENQGVVPEKGYGMLLREKSSYLFKNYRHASAKRILFPGCNFPSLYPETLTKLSRMLEEKAGIGMVLDCCGKPVAELGLEKAKERIIGEIQMALDRYGIEEVVMLCPNCYYFLKPQLRQKVTSIYVVLRELGIGRKIKAGIPLYIPCPDREDEEWVKTLKPFLEEDIKRTEGIQCCGLGGCAGVKEPELAGGPSVILKEAGCIELYTYCASCCGQFRRNGIDAKHLLPEILQTGEKPDVAKSLFNRAKWKLK